MLQEPLVGLGQLICAVSEGRRTELDLTPGITGVDVHLAERGFNTDTVKLWECNPRRFLQPANVHASAALPCAAIEDKRDGVAEGLVAGLCGVTRSRHRVIHGRHQEVSVSKHLLELRPLPR